MRYFKLCEVNEGRLFIFLVDNLSRRESWKENLLGFVLDILNEYKCKYSNSS